MALADAPGPIADSALLDAHLADAIEDLGIAGGPGDALGQTIDPPLVVAGDDFQPGPGIGEKSVQLGLLFCSDLGARHGAPLPPGPLQALAPLGGDKIP